jgi:DNA-binding response OmpR family regulator
MTNTPSTILLVEDDPLLRQALCLLLEDAGYRVVEAGSAAAALAAVADAEPALVLLDLGLPDRPGLDVARAMTADPATKHIPIVALTGRVGAAEKQASLDAGCVLYLTKPVDARTLLERLPGLLGRSG